MPDGTFTANRSRTVDLDASALRAALLDDARRVDLLPAREVTLRSRPASKALRFGLDEGVALVDLAPKGDGRTTVTVAHEKLPDPEAVARWKDVWGEWLAALEGLELPAAGA